MTKSFGDKIAGDKSQYPPVGAKAGGPAQVDVVHTDKTTKSSQPEVWNPTGKPTRFLKKRPG